MRRMTRTKTKPSKAQSAARSFLLVSASLFLSSCGQEPPQEAARSQPVYTPVSHKLFGSGEGLQSRVSTLIELSNQETEPVVIEADGEELNGRRLVPKSFPIGTAKNVRLTPEREEPIGELVTAFEEQPKVFEISNDASILFSASYGTYRTTESRGAELWLSEPAVTIQWDASGDRLLVQTPGRYTIYPANLEQPLTIEPPKFFGEERSSGHAYWSAEEENQLLFVTENVQFDASQPIRVLLESAVYNYITGERVPMPWSPYRNYSNMGTLPSLKRTWVHPLNKYQIRAMPAALETMTARGDRGPQLAEREGWALYAPDGGAGERLVYLATPRYGSRATRAFYQQGDTSPRQLTARPTAAVSISPDGQWIGFAVLPDAREDRYELRRVSVSDLDRYTNRMRNFRTLDEFEEKFAHSLSEELRQTMVSQGIGGKLAESVIGAFPSEPPTPEQTLQMGGKLRQLLREGAADIRFSDGLTGLREFDLLMAQVAPYLEEDPWMILAIAGFTADQFPVEHHWQIGRTAMMLGNEVDDLIYTDGLTFSAMNLYGLARERISRGVPLSSTIRTFVETYREPYYLTENFHKETLDGISWKEVDRSGFDVENSTLIDLRETLIERRLNDSIHEFTWKSGAQSGDAALEMIGAFRLAEGNPGSPRALGIFARALASDLETREAIRLLDQALSIDPSDPVLRFERGDAHYQMKNFETARADYDAAVRYDDTGTMEESVAARLALIEKAEAHGG